MATPCVLRPLSFYLVYSHYMIPFILAALDRAASSTAEQEDFDTALFG
jgi:hypothetical protein